MKIYFVSNKKRKEARRELTDEEKEIAGTWAYIGFISGIMVGILGYYLMIHLMWVK
jgi:F0F1-type ATP synthase assembly protein I